MPLDHIVEALSCEFDVVEGGIAWGVFRFVYTQRRVGTSAWQVTCPFHKKSATALQEALCCCNAKLALEYELKC